MKKLLSILLLGGLFLSSLAYADSNTMTKSDLIEFYLTLEQERLESLHIMEDYKENTGLSSMGEPVYTYFPEVPKSFVETLSKNYLMDVRESLNSFDKRTLNIVYNDVLSEYKTREPLTIRWKWHTSFSSIDDLHKIQPYFASAVALSLQYQRSSAEEKLIQAELAEQARLTAENVAYEAEFKEGIMPSPQYRKVVEQAIESKLVPQALQTNYQSPITGQQFIDLFIQAHFTSYNAKMNEYTLDPRQIKAWGTKELNEAFLLKHIAIENMEFKSANTSLKVAYLLGLIDTIHSMKFDPDESLTREQLAVMLSNYFQVTGNTINGAAQFSYSDLDDASDWAYDAVARASVSYLPGAVLPTIDEYGNRIASGLIKPQTTLTCEEAIQVVKQLAHDGNFDELALRGIIRVTMDMIRCGLDVSDDAISLRKGHYDTPVFTLRNSLPTSLKKHSAQSLIGSFAYVGGDTGTLDLNAFREEVLKGKSLTQDYMIYTVHYNTPEHLFVVTKDRSLGYTLNFYGHRFADAYRADSTGTLVSLLNESFDPNNRPSKHYIGPVAKWIKADYLPVELKKMYQQPITRAEFAKLAVTAILKQHSNRFDLFSKASRAAWGIDALTPEYILKQVDIDKIFADTNDSYVKVAYIFGLLDSDADNNFYPNATIRREDLAEMLVKSYQISHSISPKGTANYSDIDDASADKRDAVNMAAGSLIRGRESFIRESRYSSTVFKKGVFGPHDIITREEAIKILDGIIVREHLNIRGIQIVTPDHLACGLTVSDDSVSLHRGTFDYPEFQLKRTIPLDLRQYSVQELLSASQVLPVEGLNKDAFNSLRKRILSGEQFTAYYNGFEVEYNLENYLYTATKDRSYGYTYIENGLRWKNGQLVHLVNQ